MYVRIENEVHGIPSDAGEEANAVHDELNGDGQELSRTCDKSHVHQHLVDGRAASAARYPEGICKARGIAKEEKERSHNPGAVMQVGEEFTGRKIHLEEFHENDKHLTAEWDLRRLMERPQGKQGISEALAWDDLTGMKLDAGKVVEARAKEVGYIGDKRVYNKIFGSQANRNGWVQAAETNDARCVQ